ncbi:UDP-glucose 4-epimerase GalE [Candidatus Margulisiibacteriota bacterium]
MSVLVTGGAGFIGSVTSRELLKQGYDVVILDNLSYGHKQTLPKKSKFIEADLLDKASVLSILKKEKIDAVIHFAGFTSVGESVREPLKYFTNNVLSGINLLDSMIEVGADKMIFSSSAAVYGDPKRIPIKEEDELNPESPYGESKRLFEGFLGWYDMAHGIRSVSLRYFNAAGADLENGLGEDHDPETHLIPLILQTASGKRKQIDIYGTDYDTPDGTCVRDYVHVKDLAAAHILALKRLENGGASSQYNLGSSKGHSVREVIDMCKKVTGKNIKAVEAPRRPGDPPKLVASSDKVQKELSFKFKHSDIKNIIETAWEWHSKHPKGYQA